MRSGGGRRGQAGEPSRLAAEDRRFDSPSRSRSRRAIAGLGFNSVFRTTAFGPSDEVSETRTNC